jgi:hypothetical protein
MRTSFVMFGGAQLGTVVPTKLTRTTELLRRVHGDGRANRDNVSRAAALRWMQDKQSDSSLPATSIIARGLASLYLRPPQGVGQHETSLILLHISANLSLLSFQTLWALWELGEPTLGVVAQQLATVVRERAKSPRLARHLPEWAIDPRFDFMRPMPGLVTWVERARLSLVQLDFDRVRLKLGTGLGAALLVELIRTSSDAWWSRQDPQQVRFWGAGRSLEVRGVIAERQLVMLGLGATSVAEVPRSEEARALKTWVLQQIGDPGQRPGAWRTLSPRAAEVFEWLLLWDELALIFEEFARNAEDARAVFWRDYLPYVRDARFYRAYDTAVCMLAFERLLIIEFGTTGNATYIYERPQVNLRRMKLPPNRMAGHFKRWQGINFEGIQCGYHMKLNHTSNWQTNFQLRLEELGLTRRPPRASMSESSVVAGRTRNLAVAPPADVFLGDYWRSKFERDILANIGPRESKSLGWLRGALGVEVGSPQDRALEAALANLFANNKIFRMKVDNDESIYRY